MRKLYGLALVILGGLIIIGAAIVEVIWLGFCFGTVLVGLFLLFVMPALLIAPIVIGFGSGSVILMTGLNKMRKAGEEEAEELALEAYSNARAIDQRAHRIAERKRREKEEEARCKGV